MSTPLRALIVEDSAEDARLLLRELERGGYDVSFERVETAEGLHEALARETWDVIFCDFSLPRFDGFEALRIAQESRLDLPFIFVSGKMGEDVAVEAMKSGAHDYVMKSNLTRLAPAVERELRDAIERNRRRLAEEAMRVSEFKYRHLFENMSDAAFLIEEQTGRVIDTNRRAEALLGLPRAGILGLDQDALFPPNGHGASLVERLREDRNCTLEIARGDGAHVPLQVCASRIELYGRTCLFALCREVEERG
jgi:PAS domain S-box-containing protein